MRTARRTPLLLRRLVARTVTAVAVGSVLAATAIAGPAAIGDGPRGDTTTAPRLAGDAPVELKRRKGHITGDGGTRYVANRTEFRPGRARVQIPPRLRGRSWIVADLDDGRILGRHEARKHLPQASTIKLLTALTAVRTLGPRPRHRVTRFEAKQICSCAGLRRGSRYARDTLIAGMLLPSGNDAAEALAGSHPRGRHAFYAAMNRNARRLGATDTVARNASGLTAWGSHSSARDLVLLLRAALKQPRVRGVLEMRSARIETVGGRGRHRVWRGTDYVNKYPDALGKSGWTTPAKNTLVVATEIDGRTIAFASMGVPSGGYTTSGARRLTEWASRNYDGLKAVGRLPKS